MGRSLDKFSNLSWTAFKQAFQLRGLKLQWVLDDDIYYLAAKDDGYTFECMLKPESDTEHQAYIDRQDFIDNFKDNANKPQQVMNQTTGAMKVAIEKPDDSSTTLISHDWCDPTSWFYESIEVTNKTPVIDTGKTYNIGDINIVDIIHGKITDEDEVDRKYLFQLADDGTPLVEGTDYTVDYKTGKFTIADAYTVQGALLCNYYKSDGSGFLYEPKAGKILILEHPELNFSKDCFINTHIDFEVWVGNPYFNPANPIVAYDPNISIAEHNCLRFPYKKKTYKNEKDLVNAANLGQGFIPKFGNLPADVLVFPFNYVTTTSLKASQLAQLIIRLKKDSDGNNIPLTGSYGTVSFYVISLNE